MSVETTKRRIKVLLIDQDESARQELRRAFGVAPSEEFLHLTGTPFLMVVPRWED